jgi:predicted dehydrogenase
MGSQHLRVLSGLSGVELIAVYDEDREKSTYVPIGMQTNSLDELISRQPDYCVVAAPTIHHEEIGLRLAAAGIHCLIEKPLSLSSESASRIANAFTQAGLIGAVGQIERYNPALIEARKRILSGQLGKIFQVATRRQGPFPSRIQDVGVILDLATHDIDLTSWLMDQRYLDVKARTSFTSGRQHEDLVAVVGLLSSGVITSHLVNWVSPIKERTAIITGEEGALVVDTLMADLTFYKNGAIDVVRHEVAMFRGVREGDVIRYAIPKPEPLVSEHEAFRDAVLGKAAEIVSLNEGLETIKVTEMIRESSRSGRTALK